MGEIVVDEAPREQMNRFLAKYSVEVRSVARKAIAKLRVRLPGAIELVYDNYNALAIGFSSSERAADVIVSIALYPRWVSLFFMQGAKLPDPQRLLRGSGRQVRHIVLGDAMGLGQPAVDALVGSAIDRGKPLPTGRRRTIIKSVSAKQRARRPPSL